MISLLFLTGAISIVGFLRSRSITPAPITVANLSGAEEYADPQSKTNANAEAFCRHITEEESKLQEAWDLHDAGEKIKAMTIVHGLMHSTNSLVRMEAVDFFQWTGKRALPEITAMINDSSPDVATSALMAWEIAYGEITGDTRLSQAIENSLRTLKRQEDITALLHHVGDLKTKTALLMLSRIIDDNPANVLGECCRESYSDLTDGEIYTSKEDTIKYLEERK